MTRILCFAGSTRRESLNKRLALHAVQRLQELGASGTWADLADDPMPLYNGDLEAEQGIPAHAVRLRQLLLDHEALLLVCPEYNGSITPLLKNTLDWISRPSENVAMTAAYAGKVAALLSASPGGLGGIRGLSHVRQILGGIGVHVVPGDLAVGGAHQAFDDQGRLSDPGMQERLTRTLQTLIRTTNALRDSTA